LDHRNCYLKCTVKWVNRRKFAMKMKNVVQYTGCPKNCVLTVHYGEEEITVKMLKKFNWTYFLIWRSLKVALNRSIILQYTVWNKSIKYWL
jgi:hypothetical protein